MEAFVLINVRQPIVSVRLNAPAFWLGQLDIIGLIATLGLVVLRIPLNDAKTFTLLLVCISIIAWLACARSRSHLPRQLHPRRIGRLLIPWIAAAGTLCITALLRDYYSGTALLIFATSWTLWMLVSRLTLSRIAQQTRVLFVGQSPFYDELIRLPQLNVTQLTQVPDTFDTWDLIALDPRANYSDEWLQWLAHADVAGKSVIKAPLLIEIFTGQVSTQVLHGRWASAIFHGNSNYSLWKRALDLSITLFFAPLIALACLAVATAIATVDGRPVFFWQERVGKNGQTFKMVKFRSMRQDSEQSGAQFATKGDLRVTRLGAFLRKYRLDELPQFWNVFKGDMSIIGPRPEQRVFVEQFETEVPLFDIRHHVRPGITGWAQVKLGYTAGADEASEKLRCDFYYIKHFSFGLDFLIVCRTIRTILSGFGAR